MKKRNLIVQVTTNRPMGGVASVLKNVERYFSHSEFAFEYLFAENGHERSFDEYVMERGSTVYLLPRLSAGSFPAYARAVYQYYKRNAARIAAVHVHSPNMALFHFLVCKHFGVRIRILHSHSTRYSDTKWKSWRNVWLIAPALRLLTHRFACGAAAADFLFGRGASSKTFILHNAIATSEFAYDVARRSQKRRELSVGEADILLGHVGNFLRVKNHAFLLDVFAEFHRVCPQAVLLLVGEGPLEPEVRAKVRHLGLDDAVRFMGYRADIPDLLMAMDAFLFPSLFEGFPVSLVEAQCAGLPCFVSDTVTPEAKITDTVFFLPIAGPDASSLWKEKMLSVLPHFQRCDQSVLVVQAGYDLAHEVKALERYYSQIVHETYASV